jgi:hypothetical protein
MSETIEVEKDFVREAIVCIHEKEGVITPRKTILGHIECPKCYKALEYRISSSNGRIWGQCTSDDCLKWT